MESPEGQVTITVANYLTLGRLVVVPIFWVFFFSDSWSLRTAATILFSVGAITDLWDGKLARRFDQVTRFGNFMDPLVDKVLILSAYWALVIRESFGVYTTLAVICVILISVREVGITFMRIWAMSGGSSLMTSAWGKWKTGVQLTTLILTLLLLNLRNIPGEPVPALSFLGGAWFYPFTVVLFVICAITSTVSGVLYIRGAFSNRTRGN